MRIDRKKYTVENNELYIQRFRKMNVEPAANIVITSKLSRKKRKAKRSLEITTRRMGKTKKRFFFLFVVLFSSPFFAVKTYVVQLI